MHTRLRVLCRLIHAAEQGREWAGEVRVERKRMGWGREQQHDNAIGHIVLLPNRQGGKSEDAGGEGEDGGGDENSDATVTQCAQSRVHCDIIHVHTKPVEAVVSAVVEG